MKNFRISSYLTILIAVLTAIGLVKFILWAPQHQALDWIVISASILGIAMNILYLLKKWQFLPILMTIGYSIAGVEIITNSVGSFVDAFQGINMFGDASQVNTIIMIAGYFLLGTLLTIILSFMVSEDSSVKK